MRDLGRKEFSAFCYGTDSLIQDVGDHPLGVMLVGAIAERSPEVDPVDLAMTFLTGMFGLLATDDASTAHRRRRLDLLVRLTSTETSGR